jgi:hypothetical protein
MNPESLNLNLPIHVGATPQRMQLTGEQYVKWWMSNLEILAANGQLDRILVNRLRTRVGVPFCWKE